MQVIHIYQFTISIYVDTVDMRNNYTYMYIYIYRQTYVYIYIYMHISTTGVMVQTRILAKAARQERGRAPPRVDTPNSLRKLGIIANYMPNYSLKPWIDTVADGLVDDWNKVTIRTSCRQEWMQPPRPPQKNEWLEPDVFFPCSKFLDVFLLGT